MAFKLKILRLDFHARLPGLHKRFDIAVRPDGVQPRSHCRGEDARLGEHVAVLVEVLRRYAHQLLRLLEQRAVFIGQRLRTVGRKREQIDTDVASERDDEISRAVPQSLAREHDVIVGDGNVLIDLQGIKVGKPGLADAIELHRQLACRLAAVEEAEIDRNGMFHPVLVSGECRVAAHVGVGLLDVTVAESDHRAASLADDACDLALIGESVAVEPQPFVAAPCLIQLGGTDLVVPFAQAGLEVGVGEIAAIAHKVVAHGLDHALDFPLDNLELGHYVLARDQQERAAKIGVVGV